MNRWALIVGNSVENVVEQDSAPQIPGTWVPCTGTGAGPGWTYVDGVFSPPGTVAAVPQSVTMRQARLALRAAGKLTSVETAIDALPEPDKTDARIWWEYSGMVERNQPLVIALGAAVGLTVSDLDNLFTQAAVL